MELVLDIEGRDRPVVVELRNTLNPDDTDAVRTSGFPSDVDMAEGMKKIAYGDLWNTIKFVNDKHNLLVPEKTREPFKERQH